MSEVNSVNENAEIASNQPVPPDTSNLTNAMMYLTQFLNGGDPNAEGEYEESITRLLNQNPCPISPKDYAMLAGDLAKFEAGVEPAGFSTQMLGDLATAYMDIPGNANPTLQANLQTAQSYLQMSQDPEISSVVQGCIESILGQLIPGQTPAQQAKLAADFTAGNTMILNSIEFGQPIDYQQLQTYLQQVQADFPKPPS
jgi:hypothetical protein